MLEGALEKLGITPGSPAGYQLVARHPGADGSAQTSSLPLNGLLGCGMRIEYAGRITCSHCGTATPRSYGGGYCYRCFRTLARCDLCVVSPDRCHYHLGTCREPEWGEAFCMQPHLVYLANSSGPKVGITSAEGAVARWLDQGASQGLVIARTVSRHLAGVLEVRLARMISDRTDWRVLLRGVVPAVDLAVLRDGLRERLGDLPGGVDWLDGQAVTALDYPVLGYPQRLSRLRLDVHPTVAGRLLGAKGQYLLFEHGVFNVRWHRAFEVRVQVAADAATVPVEPADGAPDDSQLELFT